MPRAFCRCSTWLCDDAYPQYSVEFYKTLEAETGLNAGFAVVGNLRMAQTQERMDEYMLYASTAETCGVSYEWLNPDKIKDAGR